VGNVFLVPLSTLVFLLPLVALASDRKSGKAGRWDSSDFHPHRFVWLESSLWRFGEVRAIFLLAAAALLTGCKVTTFTYTMPGGQAVTARDTRLLVNTRATIVFQHGTNFSLSVKTASSADQEAIAAAFEGAVRGAK
jgi:hypothetical protein